MALNKLEKEIREKLNAREIQPSAQAWDRLDAMLSVAENTKTKTPFPWLKIAAGFVVFITIGFFFITQNKDFSKTNNSSEIVVETSKKDSEVNNESIVSSESNLNIKNEEIQNVQHSDSNEKATEKIEITEKSNVKGKPSKIQKFNNQSIAEVAPQKTNQPEALLENKAISKEVLPEIDSKQVVLVEKSSVNKPKLKVDASTLLNQVEGEVQLTFRQKVMKSIVQGYKETKESLASRNQE